MLFGQKDEASVEVLVILEENPRWFCWRCFFLKEKKHKDNCVKQQGATERWRS